MTPGTCNPAVPKSVPGTKVYGHRQPERSAAYRVIQGHLETWLTGCHQADEEGSPVAAYIEQYFRKYLECGILRMASPEQDVPAVDTIFSSPFLVKDAESDPPAIPGGCWRRQPT
jgi:hypothetical protein